MKYIEPPTSKRDRKTRPIPKGEPPNKRLHLILGLLLFLLLLTVPLCLEFFF